MFTQKLKWFALGIVLLFSGSGCKNASYLLNIGIEKQNPYLIWQAFVLGESDASAALFNLKLSGTSKVLWYDVLALNGNIDAAKYLADNTIHKGIQTHYYKLAAEQGDANAQFEYALLQDANLSEMQRFLTLSAEQGYPPAVIAYAKFLHAKLDANEADILYWLDKASKLDAESAIKLAKRFWLNHNKKDAIKYFEHAKSMGNSRASAYINVLQNYNEQTLNALFDNAETGTDVNCLQTIQPIARSLESMVQAVSMYNDFKKDERLASLDMCLLVPRWLPENEMKCHFDTSTGRNTCDLIELASYKKNLPFSHMVFFVERGKAYVQNGIMYVDLADEYSVFVHELAHFVGFVDEYKLTEATANNYCMPDSVPNLLFYEPSAPEAQKKLAWWNELFDKTQRRINMPDDIEGKKSVATILAGDNALGQSKAQKAEPIDNTGAGEGVALDSINVEGPSLIEPEPQPSLSISSSRACDSLDIKSFKPTSEITFLEHHDTENIPALYIHMWQAMLEEKTDEKPLIKALFNAANQSKNADLIDHWADVYYSL